MPFFQFRPISLDAAYALMVSLLPFIVTPPQFPTECAVDTFPSPEYRAAG